MKVIIFLVLLFMPSGLFAQRVVRIGTFMLPPFMMEVGANRVPGGVAVDYWKKYIAPRLGVKVEAYGPFPAMRTVKLLEDGLIDVIPNMTKIPERAGKFIFPPTPLAEITACLVVRRDSPLLRVTGWEDLYNYKIGFLEGGYVPPLLRHEKISFEMVSGTDYFERCLEKLDMGRIDAVLHINYLSLRYDFKISGEGDHYRIVSLPVDRAKVYCVFRKTERGRALAAEFEKINAPLFRAGVYDRLALEYLK